jgi:hypothetical protein
MSRLKFFNSIFNKIGYNCFIIFQYYYLNIEILSFWNFLKILKSCEIFESSEILLKRIEYIFEINEI